jgi:hypothetical protein
MSDTLVQLQDWIAQFPSWMVAGGIGFVVVVVAIVFWKAMKIAVTALIVAVVVAVGWYVWENVSGPEEPEPEPTMSPMHLTEPAPLPPAPPASAPTHGPARTPPSTPAP